MNAPVIGKRARFLLVDDDDVDREVLTRLLGRIDPRFELVEAGSIEEARGWLAEGEFDCVLLDYHLGGPLGFDLLPYIQSHREEICPVILVTMRESETLIVEAIRSGISDYIPKRNLEIGRLQGVVESVLARAAAEEAQRVEDRKFHEFAEAMRLKYEASLREAADRAEAASIAKGRFVANMSHEIRTPLNTVIGVAYLLRRTDLDEEQSELIDKIEVASKSLLGVINNVLDASRLGDRAIQIERVAASPASVMADLVKLAEVQIGGRPIDLKVSIAENVPDQIVTDPTRLHQIVLNLLTNAIKFTESGSVSICLETRRGKCDGLRLHVMVSDTGIGMDAESLDRLFQPFTQADNSTTRRFGGSGLGLAISHELAVLMGGHITARSEPGLGSTFELELPCEPVSEAGGEAQPEVNPSLTDDQLAGVSILLVDDCEINQEIAARILRMEGAVVTTAANGQEAVDLVLGPGSCFDLVLMDLQMPILDGYDAFRRIEGALGELRPPVLALTAGAARADEEAFDLGGMDGLVPKPFEVEHLIQTVYDFARRPAWRVFPRAATGH